MTTNLPEGVRGISYDNLKHLGVHETTGELYWKGKKVVVQRPVTLGALERTLALVAALSTFGVFIIELGRSAGWWTG